MQLNEHFWLDRPVFVTGADGLLGGWLTRQLVGLGAQVVCLLRDWDPRGALQRAGLRDRVQVVRGDVTDQPLIERALGEFEVKTVFHLAAQTIVGIAKRNPISTFESNIRGSWTVLEACRRSPLVSGIVVASSDKAYGASAILPYSEDTPLLASFPYDVSKACTDQISQCYASTFGSRVIITRCGNFYGGGDLNWNRIVPGTIRSVLRGERPVIRSDGEFVRDYLYVEEGAAAYLMLAEAIAENPALAGEAFNLSTESPLTVLDMVNAILKTMNSDLQPVIRNEAAHEIRAQHLSAAKIRERLGWAPQFDLETGLRRTVQWYRHFFEQT